MDGKPFFNELEVVEGMKPDRGYISPYFITNQKNQKRELEDSLILIHVAVKVLELALKWKLQDLFKCCREVFFF
uniref:Uncharacterized protein n=1 Tax=Lotus japonicus TaxID=34305 RepID=I3SUY0_LOTJA|nr:unknown [Lotus japonicus]